MILRTFLWATLLFASCGAVAAASPAIRAGNSWTFEAYDGYGSRTRPSGLYRVDVISVSDAQIATRVTDLNGGNVSYEQFTLGWNPVSAEWLSGTPPDTLWEFNSVPDRLVPGIRWARGVLSNEKLSSTPSMQSYEFSPPYPELPDRLQPGASWQSKIVSRNSATGRQMEMSVSGSVIGEERMHTPAGDFDTVKVERKTYLEDANYSHSQTLVIDVEWFAPALGRSVKYSTRSESYDKANREGPVKPVPGAWTVYELTAYNQK